MNDRAARRFRNFCWASVVLVLAVIVWGAYVRASGSGAGCGSHWPTCNGEVLPRNPSTKTLVELTHRITSGLSGLVVLLQVLLSWKLYPFGHRVQKALGWSLFFMITEGAIGAGIVVFEYVAENASVARALWMAVHLVNTFMLVAAMTLAAHFAGGGRGFRLRGRGLSALLAGVAVAGMLLTGMSGAVAALGDTLFPADSLQTGLADDLSATAHVLIRLRIIHPFVAVFTGVGLLLMRPWLVARAGAEQAARWGGRLQGVVLLQLAFGLTTLLLLAPTAMQLLHLLLAQLVWITLVLFLAHSLAPLSTPEA